MDAKQIVKEYYNAEVAGEWKRIGGRPEFILTCRYLDRYVRLGERVLDIGGGPGRYSLYLAEKGCDVTLFDLSEKNIEFASAMAKEKGLALKSVCGDACEADKIVDGKFDHVLLMGPMYHLLEEADRVKAAGAACALLKSDGVLFVSFINMIAGMIYGMKCAPAIVASTDPFEMEYKHKFIAKESYGGDAFTKAFFIEQNEILPFMARFPLEKLHLFGQESITSPCESNIMSQPPEVVSMWMELAEKVCEREELLSWSEHLMYVGRKK